MIEALRQLVCLEDHTPSQDGVVVAEFACSIEANDILHMLKGAPNLVRGGNRVA